MVKLRSFLNHMFPVFECNSLTARLEFQSEGIESGHTAITVIHGLDSNLTKIIETIRLATHHMSLKLYSTSLVLFVQIVQHLQANTG